MYDDLYYNLYEILFVYFYRYTQRSDKLLVRLENAITMCIKSLPIDLQNKYYDFALFVHDLNIKPEVIL